MDDWLGLAFATLVAIYFIAGGALQARLRHLHGQGVIAVPPRILAATPHANARAIVFVFSPLQTADFLATSCQALARFALVGILVSIAAAVLFVFMPGALARWL